MEDFNVNEEIEKEADLNNDVISKGTDLSDLPPLPEREWITGIISEVKADYRMFNGKITVRSNPDGTPILDKDGKEQPIKKLKLTIALEDYKLGNGEPRLVWLDNLGLSLHKRSHLSTVLVNLFPNETIEKIVVKDLISKMVMTRVKLQIVNKVGKASGKPYSVVLWDTLKLAE